MRKKLLDTLTILGITALAAAVVVGFVAMMVASTGHAQGGVSTFGLSARYMPAFTGAGIETGALLGPFCKSASVTGGTLTIVCEDDDDPTNPDATTTFTGVAGGQTDPRAVLGITYDHAAQTFTFTQAGGTTLTCRLDVDCPIPASQTIYAAIREADSSFIPSDFTNNMTGVNANGQPRLDITFPTWTDSTQDIATQELDTRYLAWALPAALTVTEIDHPRNGYEMCELIYGDTQVDCSSGVDITINQIAYTYYATTEPKNLYSDGTYAINWSE